MDNSMTENRRTDNQENQKLIFPIHNRLHCPFSVSPFLRFFSGITLLLALGCGQTDDSFPEGMVGGDGVFSGLLPASLTASGSPLH